MSIVAELMSKPGVLAAGQYAYRGDRFSYKGALNEHYAQMASIMCRATTLSTVMEAEMLAAFHPNCGIQPARGWLVRGPTRTVCVVANTFCMLDNALASPNEIMNAMRQALADTDADLI